MNEDTKELMLDLLINKEIYGLTRDEAEQLQKLSAADDGQQEALSIGLTAAAISLVELDTDAKLPAHIEARIADAATEHFDSFVPVPRQVSTERPHAAEADRGSWFNWLGWVAAAAACIVLGINLYTTRRTVDVARVEAPVEQQQKLTPEQMRLRLMESATDIAKADLAGGKGFENVVGDAVWSDEKQAGYLRFRGLPVNDRSKETYQLWIFDETQDEKTPIDGGTFDIDRNGEVIIPITAKLAARRPKAFAVTVEKPGGVVVSKREKIAAIGKTSA